MTQEEALRKAVEIIDQVTGQVKNERGYVHDKWKPVELNEWTFAVLKLADFLMSD